MDTAIVIAGYGVIAYLLLSWIYRLARGLWILKLGHMLGFGERFKPRENSWAIITGSTDGIGLAYAHEFMRKGYNLLLISRNSDRLKAVKEELEVHNHKKKEIRLHKADFSKLDIYDAIEKEIKKLPQVDLLINNVGMSYEYPDYFASEAYGERNLNIINVNVISCMKMCYIVLPIMEQQKRGVILNISSFSALDPCPLLSIYASTKAFVDHFTRSIAYEYAKKGVCIQSVLPGFVATKMSKIKKAALMTPNATDYVSAQLNTVGLDMQTTGYWTHELQCYITQNVFPAIHSRSLASNIAFKQMKIVRQKAIKKLQHGSTKKD